MINTHHYPNRTPQNPILKNELSRVISAAVVNRQFCALLLKNPTAALSTGYSGENFSLAQEERAKLGTIRASSLAEFAAQVAAI